MALPKQKLFRRALIYGTLVYDWTSCLCWNCLYVTETIVSTFDVTLQICNIHCHKKELFVVIIILLHEKAC